MDNYVAKLNEYKQKQRLVLQFEEVGAAGPDHIKTAVLGGKAYPDGVGKNKKEARQNAAKNVLTDLLEEPADATENAAEASNTSAHQISASNNYISWLNEYGQKNRVLLRPVETTRPGTNNQWCSFVVGDKAYPTASGKTRREAKEEAARLVYHEICGRKSSETGDEKCIFTSSQQSEEIKENAADVCHWTKSSTLRTEEKDFTESNFIGLVNHYCQKTSRSYTLIEENICGPPHIRQFFYKLVIDSKEYPVGEGRSAKEAKQNAAQLAWSALQEQSDWDSKITVRSAVLYDGAPAKLSIPPSTLHPKSSSITITTNDSDVLSTSSSPFKAQIGDGRYSGSLSHQRDEINQNNDENCTKAKSLIIKGEGESSTGENFIGIINLYCQKTKCCHDYVLVRKCGPPHRPQFSYKAVIDGKEYPVGEGNTVKEAKQHAAQQAWSALQEQSNWVCKVCAHKRKDSWEISSCPFSLISMNFMCEHSLKCLTSFSNDVTPVQLSTPTSTLMSPDAKSERIPTATSDLVVSPKVPKPPRDQDQNPDLKPKRKIAANFNNASTNRKKELQNSDCNVTQSEEKDGTDTNVRPHKPSKEKGKEKRSSTEKTSSKIVASRFTSEFDPIKQLGKGAFGHVFKAKHKLLEEYYAIKIVRCKMGLREVSALSDLHHSNIVRYYTCWMEDLEYQWDSTADRCGTSQFIGDSPAKYLYIQMELCDTKILRVWIDERNTLNVKKSLRDSKRREDSLIITQQIVSGVKYIHSKMFIHGDLKPANIMFGRDRKVKIGDFGLVTAEIEDDAENLLERSAYKGTPSYMAPEQKSKSHYDRKVDIFALGLIYFELLWNLFAGSERKVVWDNARSQKLPQGFLNNFPQEHQIIKAMLCVKPEDRPEASRLNKELKEYAHARYMQKTHFEIVTLFDSYKDSKEEFLKEHSS